MNFDAFTEKIATELVTKHGAHTVLLYGSRSDGTHGFDSDYDIAAFAAVDATVRIARWDDGLYLDAFIHPERVLQNPSEEHLSLRDSKIVLQRGNSGQEFLAALDEIHHRGPVPKTKEEIEVLKIWAHKMASRMERGDTEGNYRRSWLLTALLEDYFHIHGLWWMGPKKALQWLEQNEPKMHQSFVFALNPVASNQAIVSLVEHVTGRSHGQFQ